MFVGQVMSHYRSDQIYQRSQVSWVTLWHSRLVLCSKIKSGPVIVSDNVNYWAFRLSSGQQKRVDCHTQLIHNIMSLYWMLSINAESHEVKDDRQWFGFTGLQLTHNFWCNFGGDDERDYHHLVIMLPPYCHFTITNFYQSWMDFKDKVNHIL